MEEGEALELWTDAQSVMRIGLRKRGQPMGNRAGQGERVRDCQPVGNRAGQKKRVKDSQPGGDRVGQAKRVKGCQPSGDRALPANEGCCGQDSHQEERKEKAEAELEVEEERQQQVETGKPRHGTPMWCCACGCMCTSNRCVDPCGVVNAGPRSTAVIVRYHRHAL